MQEQKQKKLRLDENGVPYAICPECDEQIYNVVLTQREFTTYDVSPDENGKLNYEEVDREIDEWNDDFEYRCPVCDEVIAESEEEAEALFYDEPEQDSEDDI